MAGPACAIAFGALLFGMASNPADAQLEDDPPLAVTAAAGRPSGAAVGERSAAMNARRRTEQDALARQDAALALARLGVAVDWRTVPLDKLVDMRMRATKAAELRADFDVVVDWRQHSWSELETMREMLARFRRAQSANAAARGQQPAPAATSASASREDDVMHPTFAWRPRPEHRNADPDGVITPTFSWRPVAHRGSSDPEDVITPTFAPFRRRVHPIATDPDDLIEP
jgi:hypothetical protein